MENIVEPYRCGDCNHYMKNMNEEKKRILTVFKLYKCDEFTKLCNKDTPTNDCYKFSLKGAA